MQHLKNLIEAALFIAAKPMTVEELQKVKGLEAVPAEELLGVLKSMEVDYDSHGIKVSEDSGRFELRIKDEFVKSVEHLAPNRDFSRATLQTLSLIAYKSPAKQSEIIETRGNRAYDHVKELLERGFIRSEAKGHTNILSITQKFLDYFSLKSTDEVKDYFTKKIERDERKASKKKDPVPAGDAENKENSDIPAVPEEPNAKADEPEEHMIERFNKETAE